MELICLLLIDGTWDGYVDKAGPGYRGMHACYIYLKKAARTTNLVRPASPMMAFMTSNEHLVREELGCTVSCRSWAVPETASSPSWVL